LDPKTDTIVIAQLIFSGTCIVHRYDEDGTPGFTSTRLFYETINIYDWPELDLNFRDRLNTLGWMELLSENESQLNVEREMRLNYIQLTLTTTLRPYREAVGSLLNEIELKTTEGEHYQGLVIYHTVIRGQQESMEVLYTSKKDNMEMFPDEYMTPYCFNHTYPIGNAPNNVLNM